MKIGTIEWEDCDWLILFGFILLGLWVFCSPKKNLSKEEVMFCSFPAGPTTYVRLKDGFSLQTFQNTQSIEVIGVSQYKIRWWSDANPCTVYTSNVYGDIEK